MIFELEETKKAAPWFAGWQETMIWSCLERVMGKIYADSPEDPVSAMALLGDFCFFAGKPDRRLILYEPVFSRRDFLILTPRDEEWGRLIEECYREQVRKATRYAIKKEPDVFPVDRLRAAVAGLADGYVLRMMDEELFGRCREIPWCRDWVALYRDYDQYRRYGLGAVILKDGEPVSGASSYSGYSGGIEIEIDTREDCRRQGLAYVCGAKLILECLKRGLYPSWDAQNMWSVGLAGKLGYHFDRAYTVYELRDRQAERLQCFPEQAANRGKIT